MKVTFLLIAVNLVFFGLQMTVPGFTDAFALIPDFAMNGAYWQFITYMFLHGNPAHILINMFVLGIFGPLVEHWLGRERFILLYFLAGLGSAFLYISLTGASLTPMLGASGAVFGILAAYAFLFPKNIILVFFIPMPALFAVIAIMVFELLAGALGLMPGIAHFGHLGGAITGLVFMFLWRKLSKRPSLEDRRPASYEFIWE